MRDIILRRVGACSALAVMIVMTLTAGSSMAQQQTGGELADARAVMGAESPEETLRLLDRFLEDYPESRYLIQGLLDRGITTVAQLDPESPRLIKYAQSYFRLYPSEAIGYNNVAWTLYEVNAALDIAAAWADTAIALLPAGDSDREKADRAMVLDTVSHIAFSRGDVSTAIAKQQEAVELAPDDDPNFFVYRSGLGEFLVGGQRWDEAEKYLTEVLLNDAEDETALEAFEKLVSHKVSEGMDPDEYREGAISRGIDRMLAGAEDVAQAKLTVAVNLTKLGMLMDRAMEFALEAVRESGPEKGAEVYKNSRVALARVYAESGDYESAIETLEPVSRLIGPLDLDYYITKASSFSELGKKEEAIATYLEVAPVYPAPMIMEPLQALWEEIYGTESSMRDTLVAIAEEMAAWHVSETFNLAEGLPGRVVLAELFTGSECGPCQASDLAFDALIAYYPRSVSAVLIYHEHIPGPDPMTNADAVARMEYYNSEQTVVGGTPTSIMDGVLVPGGGGPAAAAKSKFGLYGWTVEQAMQKAPGVAITLEGERSGQSVNVTAGVKLEDPEVLEGAELKLRVALAERLVHFEGSNGISEHRMVVRAFVGGHEGFTIDQENKIITTGVDIAQLESDLLEYLTVYETDNPRRFRGGEGFRERKHEIDENQLLLVAFVQDDVNKRVLQAHVLELK